MNYNQFFNELKKSPVFAISLSSKELFHSNFWAWLIEYNKEFAKVFFNDIDYQNITTICREEKHRDLTIIAGGEVFIIENKIKSLPSSEQLIRYQSRERHFRKGCITGLVKFDNVPTDWNFISYGQIGNSIRNINNMFRSDKWYFLIDEYVNVIKNIESLFIEFNEQYKNRFICFEEYKKDPMLSELESIRFADVFKKYNANSFASYLTNKIKVELENLVNNEQIKLDISSGYTNKSSLVDIRYIKNKDTQNQFCIGIQIQDSQYRFHVERHKGTLDFGVKNPSGCLFNEFLAYGWFESYDRSKKLFKNRQTSMRESYCTYSSESYKFVYQYYNLTGDELNFERLASQIKEDMTKAANIMEKIDK